MTGHLTINAAVLALAVVMVGAWGALAVGALIRRLERIARALDRLRPPAPPTWSG